MSRVQNLMHIAKIPSALVNISFDSFKEFINDKFFIVSCQNKR